MLQEVFKRYEKKYLLTEDGFRRLMLTVGGSFQPDQYEQYQISNIYFDTPDCGLIRRSLEKPVYKEKLRLRAYGTGIGQDSQVFPELKKKYDQVVYKRRIQMSLREARDCFYLGKETGRRDQIFQELDYVMKRYGLAPMAYIAYERQAYTCCLDREIRLTFDWNLLGRSWDLDLSSGVWGDRILEKGLVLMELKTAGAVPLWLSHVFSKMEIFPVSFSKYGTYYQRYMIPETVSVKAAAREGGRRCA